MKIIYLILAISIIHNSGMACSFTPKSFCQTLNLHPDDLVISGEIVAVDTTGIDFKIIDRLRGEESRDVIRVWDGNDFDCNGIWSMAAADLGGLHDTVVLILPLIEEIENEWDVPGDYRRPEPYTRTTDLKVDQGVAKGFILGVAIGPPEARRVSMDYEDFRDKILEDGDCSSILLSTNDLDRVFSISINNPVTSILKLQANEVINQGIVALYNFRGERLLLKEIAYQNVIEFNLNGFDPGVYVLVLWTREKRKQIKVVKL